MKKVELSSAGGGGHASGVNGGGQMKATSFHLSSSVSRKREPAPPKEHNSWIIQQHPENP